MYISNKKEEYAMHIHKAINLIEASDEKNHWVPGARKIVIQKLLEALMWIDYQGRSSLKPEEV